MGYYNRNTLREHVSFSGIGLHSGAPVTCTVRPADAETGVVFRRLDLLTDNQKPIIARDRAGEREHSGRHFGAVDVSDLSTVTIEALAHHVSSTRLGTSLANRFGASVATVEHLLGALVICGLDDVIIDIDGAEVPILDGSAESFVAGFRAAGTRETDTPRTYWKVTEPVCLTMGDRVISVEPADRFEIDAEIDFDDPAIGRQSVSLAFDDMACRDRMAMARTFCELSAVKGLRAAGLCQGGSLENAIIVDEGRLLNGESLRDPQEFVLHKALDLIGDLSLFGKPLIGRVRAFKPGHEINTRFALELGEHPGDDQFLVRRAHDQVAAL